MIHSRKTLSGIDEVQAEPYTAGSGIVVDDEQRQISINETIVATDTQLTSYVTTAALETELSDYTTLGDVTNLTSDAAMESQDNTYYGLNTYTDTTRFARDLHVDSGFDIKRTNDTSSPGLFASLTAALAEVALLQSKSASLIMRKTQHQSIAVSQSTTITYDTTLVNTPNSGMSYYNGVFQLGYVGRYVITGECCMSSNETYTPTGGSFGDRMSHIVHSEQPNQRFAHYLVKLGVNGHHRWSWSTTIYTTVANSTIKLQLWQTSQGPVDFNSGFESTNCDFAITRVM